MGTARGCTWFWTTEMGGTVLGDPLEPWIEVGRRLGRRAGLEFVRRLDGVQNGTLKLVVRKHKGKVEEKHIEPPEPIDDRDPTGAQSRS
jgi:hypothetical protein